jgi:hypothetical protein
LTAAEPVAMLAAKTLPLARAWQPVADRIYQGFLPARRRNFQAFLKYLAFRKRFTDH